MLQTHFTDAFHRIRDELALLRGWTVTCEHELIMLERAFTFLFPRSIIPYLDFLRREGVRCNPYTFFVAASLELQGKDAVRSPLFEEAIAAALEKIGYRYHVYSQSQDTSVQTTREQALFIIKTYMRQAMDLPLNPTGYGNAMQAEAGFVTIERLIRTACPAIADQLNLHYEDYCYSSVGSRRFTRVRYEASMPESQLHEEFAEHWTQYATTLNYRLSLDAVDESAAGTEES